MQSSTLLDIDDRQSDHRRYQHGDESGELPQDDGECNETDKETPMAAAASVRKRPRMPMNSNGFCNPLNTG